jgi:DNA-binding beta-propeller fold protein YncE
VFPLMLRHAVTCVVLVHALSASGAATFTKKPAATRTPQGVRITFAVDKATDVAVCVLDAKGKVVRHLAAGVLGKNPPPPLKADSLEQSLFWDGKDDLGKKAAGGPFTVKVSLGLTPTFKRFHGNSPGDIGSPRGLAVSPDGKLYVIHTHSSHHPLDGTSAIAVFSREGKYLKTIAPFPAATPADKLRGIRTIRRRDGVRVPFVYQFETRSCLPGLGDLPRQKCVVTPKGQFCFVGIHEGPRCFAQPGKAQLVVINTDGTVPAGGALKTLIHPLTDTGASLTLAPDGKTFYATGVRGGIHACGPTHGFTCDVCDHGGNTWEHTRPVPIVFRFTMADRQGKLFLGDGGKRHAGEPKLTEPLDVATDRDGNVYIADFAADRIVVVTPQARPLGEIKVRRPFRVEVHRTTGAVYVLAGHKKIELVKFDGYKKGREVARLHIKTYRWMIPIRRPLIALDDRTDPAVIWCSSLFVRIEDLGKKFGEPVRLHEQLAERAMASVMEMTLDRVNGLLYVNNRRRLNVKTGEWTSFKVSIEGVKGGRMWPRSNPGSVSGSAGRDGNYYVIPGARSGSVLRFGPDVKERRFPVSRKDDGRIYGYAKNRARGHTADRHGNVYVLWKKGGAVHDKADFHRAHVLNKYDRDGRLVKEKLIDCQIPGISSPRVDPAGNIYVAAAVRPGTDTVPAELKGQVRSGAVDPDSVNGVNAYPVIYGSIIKFGPDGGRIYEKAGGVRCNVAYGRPIDVKGAKWIRPGISVISGWSTPKGKPGTTIACLCESPCIDVDGFGRVFYPDAGRAQVGVLDTAGNLICTFGKYGNPDSTGLSFWWPQAVAVDDTSVFVGDRLNRRIVEASLSYQREETCEVK